MSQTPSVDRSIAPPGAAKVCRGPCATLKPLGAFWASDGTPDGRTYWCGPCSTARRKERDRANAAALKFKIASMRDLPL